MRCTLAGMLLTAALSAALFAGHGARPGRPAPANDEPLAAQVARSHRQGQGLPPAAGRGRGLTSATSSAAGSTRPAAPSAWRCSPCSPAATRATTGKPFGRAESPARDQRPSGRRQLDLCGQPANDGVRPERRQGRPRRHQEQRGLAARPDAERLLVLPLRQRLAGSGGDASNTQYALLALHEAIRAGATVDKKDLQSLQQFYLDKQSKAEGSCRTTTRNRRA